MQNHNTMHIGILSGDHSSSRTYDKKVLSGLAMSGGHVHVEARYLQSHRDLLDHNILKLCVFFGIGKMIILDQ